MFKVGDIVRFRSGILKDLTYIVMQTQQLAGTKVMDIICCTHGEYFCSKQLAFSTENMEKVGESEDFIQILEDIASVASQERGAVRPKPSVGHIYTDGKTRFVVTWVGDYLFTALTEEGCTLKRNLFELTGCKLIGTCSIQKILDEIFDR